MKNEMRDETAAVKKSFFAVARCIYVKRSQTLEFGCNVCVKSFAVFIEYWLTMSNEEIGEENAKYATWQRKIT